MMHSAKQLQDMSEKQLDELLGQLRGEMRQMRFLVTHGELKQVHKIKEAKRSIARIMMQKGILAKAEPLTTNQKQG
jgi:ribosomal protein L29